MEMLNVDVPKTYVCSFSKQLMKDPVVIIESGLILDRTSLIKFSEDEAVKNKNFVALSDLKEVIKEYQIKFTCKDPVEIKTADTKVSVYEELEDDEILGSGSPTEDLSLITKKYQKKVEDVKSQNITLDKVANEVFSMEEKLSSKVQEYQDEIKKFTIIGKKFKQIHAYVPSKNIEDIRRIWLKNSKSFLQMIDNCNQVMLDYYKAKRNFEQELSLLQGKEKELIELREDLEEVLKNLGIVPAFTREFDSLSQNHVYSTKINEQNLLEKFKSGQVSNVCVQMESKDLFFQVDVTGQVKINKLHLTNSSNGLKYLKVNLQTSNSSVEFSDCRFFGVGLVVFGYNSFFQTSGNVVFKNMKIRDAPDNGLSIENCNLCELQGIQINNCVKNGIYLRSNQCEMKDTVIEECGRHGISFQVTNGDVVNCTIQNCGEYGVKVYEKCTANALNVKFGQNKLGDTIGEFNNYTIKEQQLSS